MIDEGFVEDQAGLGLGPCTPALDPKTAALLRVGVSVAIGSPGVCLEWSASRALAAGATEDEIADVLLAIAVRTLAALDEVARRSGGGGPGVTGDHCDAFGHCDAVWPG